MENEEKNTVSLEMINDIVNKSYNEVEKSNKYLETIVDLFYSLIKSEELKNPIQTILNDVCSVKEDIATLREEIGSLKETIDIYKKRDIEQTTRIRSLENNERFDYVSNIVSELIRVREIVLKKANVSNDEGYHQIIKHLDVSLSRCNVYSYQTEEGKEINPELHSLVKGIITNDKKLDGKVAESLSCGYYLEYSVDNEMKKRIINYEKINYYEYQKQER